MEMDSLTQETAPVLYLSTKRTTIDIVGGIFCSTCQLTYKNKKEYEKHYYLHNPELNSKMVPCTCVVCFKEFAGYSSLREHCYNTHIYKDKYKCNLCPKSFHKPSILKQHQNAVHAQHKCSHAGPPPCKMKFSTENELTAHMQVHLDGGPPYPCKYCNEYIKNIDSCEIHVDKHAHIIYPCPICNEDLPDKKAARIHLSKHFDQTLDNDSLCNDSLFSDDSSIDVLGGIRCYQCEGVMKNRSEFDMHFRSSHPDVDLRYMCPVCLKKFEKYEVYGRHCYEHTRMQRFTCEKCDKCFSRLSLLVCHRGVCSEDSSRPFRCARCTTRWADERRLRAHLREVHNVLDNECSEPGCGLKFEKPKDLILHQMTHKKIDNWCRQCGLDFSAISSCERHLDIHRKKTYACPICSKTYNEKYLLMKHVPQHFESIIHVCKICGRSYNAKRRLVQHLKEHSDIKSIKCSYCGKGFNRQHKYREHLNLHTSSKPYKCSVCFKSFSNHPNWSKHVRKIHKLLPKNLKPIIEKNNSNEENLNNNNSMVNINDTDVKCRTVNQCNQDSQLGETVKLLVGEELEGFELDSIMPSVLDVLETSLFEDELNAAAGPMQASTNTDATCNYIDSYTELTEPKKETYPDLSSEYTAQITNTPVTNITNYNNNYTNDNTTHQIQELSNVTIDSFDTYNWCLSKDEFSPKWEPPIYIV